MFTYPAKGQSQPQQDKDRYECHTWAVQQTGFDQSGPRAANSQGAQQYQPSKPHALRGAGRGAALGAVGGAITGNAVKVLPQAPQWAEYLVDSAVATKDCRRPMFEPTGQRPGAPHGQHIYARDGDLLTGSRLYRQFSQKVKRRFEMAKAGRPNILVLWGDDIGWWNISYNNRGQMGYRTPSIDRIGNEGAAFTDYYGQQSCTAGRAALITGQNPIRTGLTKVGLPGADVGIRAEDPTMAELLKPQGYATGQFGKNHLGDKDEFLPTVHGFDEFFGNLYHLNAEEEPEDPDYPKDPAFKKRFGPRGVLHSWADGNGGQKVEDTGPLTKKRMETIDDEVTELALNFVDKTHKEQKPFFLWYNTTAMHFRTHCPEKHKGKSGQGDYNDVMVAHDENIGRMLAKLDELGIAENTIVVYSTDNGPHYNAWPDAAITPFRSEKNTNWEGGWRVPFFIRWPGKIKPNSVFNDVASHQDLLPTFLAAAGEPEIADKLLKGHTVGSKTYKVHLDGYNLLPYLTGETKDGPRKFFFYISDDGDVLAVRMGDWKMVLMEQRAKQFMCWLEPFTKLRAPKVFNLRRDPFERADENSNTYWDWVISHSYLLYELQALVAQQIDAFERFPPRQKPASFNLDAVMRQIADASGSGFH